MPFVQKELIYGKQVLKIMNKLSYNISRIAISVFVIVLSYSYLTSILFGYSGVHWEGQISSNQRLLLNITTLLISILLVFGGYKYRYYLSQKLNHFLTRISIFEVFILSLLLRLFWVLFTENIQTSDFLGYDKTAIEILNGSNILEYISNTRNVGTSVFIGIQYYIFGYNQIIPLLTMSIISSLQVVFIYWILLKIQNRKVALFASILLAIFPEHLFLTNLLGSDILFSTIIYLALLLLTISYNKRLFPKTIFLFLSGLTFGLAHWTRSTAPIFLFSALLFLLIDNRNDLLRRFCNIFALLIGFSLIISPIIAYNYKVSGQFDIKPIHGQLGASLLIGTFPDGNGRFKTWATKENHVLLKDKINEYLIADSDISLETSDYKSHEINLAIDQVYSKIAIQRIFDSPMSFIKMVLQYKITNLWGIVAGLGFSLDNSNLSNYKSIIWAYSEIWHRVIILFSGIVLWIKLVRKRNTWDIRQILVIAALFTTISHIFLESHPRYHHMFIPLLVMYIGELPLIFNNKSYTKLYKTCS